MNRTFRSIPLAAFLICAFLSIGRAGPLPGNEAMPDSAKVKGQEMSHPPGHEMPGHEMPGHAMPGNDMPGHGTPGHEMPGSMHDHDMQGHQMQGHQMHGEGMMHGLYGPYVATREASGTSWQPDSSPHEGIHLHSRGWMVMLHGFVTGIYDRQDGPRGGKKGFSTSMLMGMAQRPLESGTLGLRAMLSLDPTMGSSGYPLLLQTGETADGRTPLIDRQHPHDLLMELAATGSLPLKRNRSVFIYAGLVGEPALGPPAFMHRLSGMDNPMAPITHHWLDSTHITYGVLTGGVVWESVKLEGSTFRGREPDQHRWNVEQPRLDSASGRLSFNPGRDWSLQGSWGYLHSPEQLHPETDQHRVTASAMYNHPLGDNGNVQITGAWGQNRNHAGPRLDGALLEGAVAWGNRNTVFARAERVRKDELFRDDAPLAGQAFDVVEATLGLLRDLPLDGHVLAGVGALGTLDLLPRALESAYGKRSPASFMLFIRARII